MHVEVVDQPKSQTGFNPKALERLRLKNLLVPTDFSDSSLKSLSYGVALARQFGAKLWLLHVVEPAPAYAGLESVPLVVTPDDEMRAAEGRMLEFAAKHVPSDVAVTSMVRPGSAVREISDFAKECEIDLVIASTHRHGRVSRILFGGISERIVHHAPCPILIVREHEHDFVEAAPADGRPSIQIGRILAPIDFSDCSRKAMRYALAFAGQFHAEILCLHVIKPERPKIIVETEAFQKDHELKARNNMEALINELDGSVTVRPSIVTGTPECEILTLAKDNAVDLIVVGEHCRTGILGRFMLGSTADEVVKAATCPVLVVRPIEREFLV